MASNYYWSSSEDSSYSGWCVYFDIGGVFSGDKDYYSRVRFVRDMDEITFTVNSAQYFAKEDMTWQQWVDSDYNTGNQGYDFASTSTYIYLPTGGTIYYVYHDDTEVKPTDKIKANAVYKIVNSSQPI